MNHWIARAAFAAALLFGVAEAAAQTAPDLDPDATIYAATLSPVNLGLPSQSFRLEPSERLNEGGTLPRGRVAIVYVDVMNRGTAPTNGTWSVVLTTPSGQAAWQVVTYISNCADFQNGRSHSGTAVIAPGETRRLCAAFVPQGASTNVAVQVEAFITGDSNPGNNQTTSNSIAVEPVRIGQRASAPSPRTTRGRR